VEITAKQEATVATVETPNSIQRLTTEEIKSNPGGNFDISRVIQALPGVSGTNGSVGGFRNDIIIRGGAPNENVYYLDGIEVPNINHFATQGSAGGPTGILNVSFIEDVTLSSSSFNGRYDNALSSVLQFKQRDGNPFKHQGNFRLSGTEAALTMEGPLSKKTTYLASVRRSYLQFLFQLLDLPIRPNYWDFQYKVTHKLSAKTSISFIGLGAIDEFSFAEPKETTPENEYVLRSQPIINQNSMTNGAVLKHLLENGYLQVALSQNYFDNRLDRFEDKDTGNEAKRLLKTRSKEIEYKLRVEVNKFKGNSKYSYGVMAQLVNYKNNTFAKIQREYRDEEGNLLQPEIVVNVNTDLRFAKYGFFYQHSLSGLDNRLNASFGIRADMNSFTSKGMNPLRTLSPRAAASYSLSNSWIVNASVGRYYKIPIYTVLGYQDAAGAYVNKDADYTRADHVVAGLEYNPKPSLRITLEGFHKSYSNYAVSVREGISLANQGGDFGAIGNEDIVTDGKGRAYGFELFLQQKLTKNIFASLSYTLFWSEFTGANGRYIPSAWDTRHLISGIFGRKFKRGWEIGMKYRFAAGAPYTPFDLEASQRNYLSQGRGRLDYGQYNALRLADFHQFDFRVDKKWNLRNFTIDLYLDVFNALLFKSPAYPQYTFARTADNSAFATTDGEPIRFDGSNAVPLILRNDDPTVTPTIGFILEF
jgi:hypothetical protein